jgi:hypothetical protein
MRTLRPPPPPPPPLYRARRPPPPPPPLYRGKIEAMYICIFHHVCRLIEAMYALITCVWFDFPSTTTTNHVLSVILVLFKRVL